MKLDFGTKLIICILAGLILLFIGLIWFRHDCNKHGDFKTPDNDILTYEAPAYTGPENVDMFEGFVTRVNGSNTPMLGGNLKKSLLRQIPF